MADYLFDGRWIRKSSGVKLGEIDSNTARAVNAARLGEIRATAFHDAHGRKVAEFDGRAVKDPKGKTLATIKDIEAVVAGGSGIELAAAWYFFVKDASRSSSTGR